MLRQCVRCMTMKNIRGTKIICKRCEIEVSTEMKERYKHLSANSELVCKERDELKQKFGKLEYELNKWKEKIKNNQELTLSHKWGFVAGINCALELIKEIKNEQNYYLPKL